MRAHNAAARRVQLLQSAGGPGADVFGVAHEVNPEERGGVAFDPAIITDFTAGEDVLFVDTRPQFLTMDGTGEITVEVWPDNLGADVLLDGFVVVRVTGGQTLTVDDIVTNDEVLLPG